MSNIAYIEDKQLNIWNVITIEKKKIISSGEINKQFI